MLHYDIMVHSGEKLDDIFVSANYLSQWLNIWLSYCVPHSFTWAVFAFPDIFSRRPCVEHTLSNALHNIYACYYVVSRYNKILMKTIVMWSIKLPLTIIAIPLFSLYKTVENARKL